VEETQRREMHRSAEAEALEERLQQAIEQKSALADEVRILRKHNAILLQVCLRVRACVCARGIGHKL
jgi:hypothetical protein